MYFSMAAIWTRAKREKRERKYKAATHHEISSTRPLARSEFSRQWHALFIHGLTQTGWIKSGPTHSDMCLLLQVMSRFKVARMWNRNASPQPAWSLVLPPRLNDVHTRQTLKRLCFFFFFWLSVNPCCEILTTDFCCCDWDSLTFFF